MLAFEIKVKNLNKLDALSQRLVMPLVEIGKTQAALLRARVLSGMDPTGKEWTRLAKRRGTAHSDGRGLWWVSPEEQQPAGWYFEIPMDAKKMPGFKVYRSYEDYVRLSPDSDRRDWHKTGTFWASVGVRARDARRVTISAYGSRKANGRRIRNRDIGYYAGKREKFGVFTYSDAERARAVATVKTSIDEQMAARAGEVSQIASIATRTSRASRRTSRLLGG